MRPPARSTASSSRNGRIAAAALLLACALLGCGGDPYGSIRNLRSAGRTVVCFGDSLTEGVGAEAGRDYPSELGRLLGMAVVNTGRRGDTSGEALARVEQDVFEHDPRVVVVLLGGNDFLRKVPLAETKKNLAAIVARVQERGAMVVVAGIRLGLFADEYADLFEEVAEKLGALYVPDVMSGILSDPALRSDRIHPNAEGYRLIAGRIAEKLKPLLERADRLRRGG
ncbi:MAG TPA: arylesterase [candidate division Zixibacteria bacterium]|nr:arylesterase [candidate division Zixibacteria bacterium]